MKKKKRGEEKETALTQANFCVCRTKFELIRIRRKIIHVITRDTSLDVFDSIGFLEDLILDGCCVY